MASASSSARRRPLPLGAEEDASSHRLLLDADLDGHAPAESSSKKRMVSYQMKDMPLGPSTYEALFSWPESLLSSLKAYFLMRGKNLMTGLKNLAESGYELVLTTSYSGMGCPEQSAIFLADQFKQVWS